MEFRLVLEKLKNSNELFNCSFTKQIIKNVRYVTKAELLDILEMLEGTVDMKFQIKLISILSVCLLFNKSSRDVIIECASLYDTLYTILSRGLPMKSAVALNFITSLVYEGGAECAGGAGGCGRERTLRLRARAALRGSGCLAAMTHLFTNYMLYTNTWKALCRCIAEVCSGSEVNQTFCSHLIPLCVQRCLQGNLEVFPVLQSILSNHKRNIKLFLDTDGIVIFDRKEYYRYESCLQLLNTVVQVIEVEEIIIIRKQNKIHENLQDLLQLHSADSRVGDTIKYVILKMKLKSFLRKHIVSIR
ncbi:uncharacterized protein [Epargyreus clarus]|uniref:uncharacterized protein n=1 Tax=Epargyreus clarus TaxID=520877 RepID=UPI003C2F14D4